MALDNEIKKSSLGALLRAYGDELSETDKNILSQINDFAADDNIALHLQNQTITDILIKYIKECKSDQNENPAETSALIYGLLAEEMEAQTQAGRSAHRSQGRFDVTRLYLRALKDQMQDHDMTQIMPKSAGSIAVLAVLNRFDPHSAQAIQEVLANEVFNEATQRIIIPVGPGHWRGVYLTKPSGDELVYELELFDPYGGIGASAIEGYVLQLLEQCGLPQHLINIRYTGPNLPQGDAYSCGDFTCAYSHKKMQEFGAPEGSYNENLIRTLDNLGNEDDVLRFATREAIHALDNQIILIPQPVASPIPIIKTEDQKPTITEQKPILETVIDPVTPDNEKQAHRPANFNSPSSYEFLITLGPTIGLPVIGAILGGILGSFLFGFGAVLGAVIGGSLGSLVMPIIYVVSVILRSYEGSQYTQEFSGSNSSVNKLTESPSNEFSPEQEPIITPSLFQKSPEKKSKQSENSEEIRPTGP